MGSGARRGDGSDRVEELGVALLAIDEGTAVLYGQNWFYDAAGNVVEYGEDVTPGGRLRSYEYTIEA